MSINLKGVLRIALSKLAQAIEFLDGVEVREQNYDKANVLLNDTVLELSNAIGLSKAIIPEHLQEICTDCGISVALGGNEFVNRIPVEDSFIEKLERGCPYPWGEYVCARCEDLLNREQDRDQNTEGLEEWIADFGSQTLWAFNPEDAKFQAEKLVHEREIIVDQVTRVDETPKQLQFEVEPDENTKTGSN